jgi:hypothetical protein
MCELFKRLPNNANPRGAGRFSRVYLQCFQRSSLPPLVVRILKVARTIADLDGTDDLAAQTSFRSRAVPDAGSQSLGVTFLKPAARTAWTQIIPSELLKQFFVAVDDSVAALDMGFGRISPSSA